jgi:DNA repair protein RadC
LATTSRRISGYGNDRPGGSVVRGKSGVLRDGRNAGNVGIFATARSGDRNISGTDSYAGQTAEIELLAELLKTALGDASQDMSNWIFEKYGRVANLLANPEHPIFSDPDLPVAVKDKLSLIARVVGSAFRHEALATPVFSHSKALLHYLHFEMASLTREIFRVLYLDAANHLLLDRIMWEGSVDRVQIHPREIVRTALETSATALILVHNHPSGQAEASREDIAITRQIVGACRLMQIAVHDHVIVAKSGTFSMRQHISHLFAETQNSTIARRLD